MPEEFAVYRLLILVTPFRLLHYIQIGIRQVSVQGENGLTEEVTLWVLQGMATRNRRVGWEMVAMVGTRRRKGVERWESGSHGHSD